MGVTEQRKQKGRRGGVGAALVPTKVHQGVSQKINMLEEAVGKQTTAETHTVTLPGISLEKPCQQEEIKRAMHRRPMHSG